MQGPVWCMRGRRLAPVMMAILLLGAAGRYSQVQAAEPSTELKRLQENAQGAYRAGSYAEALEIAKRVLALTIKEFGPDDEQAAIQEYGVGLVAEQAGKLAEAEQHYAVSVRIREKVYGPDSPAVTQAQAELGSVILRQGRPVEAKRFPECIALSEPRPQTIAATRALLGAVEALVEIGRAHV